MERNTKEFSFLADAMLGKIARKLRIFGFDTVYDSNLDDENILNSSNYIGRILLTSDKELSLPSLYGFIATRSYCSL